MKSYSKIISFILILIMVTASAVSAKAEDPVMELTIEDAVMTGLEKSLLLKQVQNEIDLSEAGKDRAKDISQQLNSADKQLIGGSLKVYQQQKLAEELGITPTADDLANLQRAMDQLNSGKNQLDLATQEVISSLTDKLGMSSSYNLDAPSTRKLLTTLADIKYSVTNDSYPIYKNQIALLIKKSYYDVLKNQKLLEVKKKAMDRGKKQYQFAKDSYEAGMKAKDDMLLADVYYKGTQLEYRKTQGELNAAMIELKKNMNIPLDTKIELTDVLADEIEEQDLSKDLRSGLQNRLEIKKAEGDVKAQNLNFRFVDNNYSPYSPEREEAKLLVQKANLNLKKAELEVESSIRQSYETLGSMGDMLNTSKEMVEQAKESVEIAEYKYKEGFGVDTSLLKKMDLESSAGTILEVLAAEENYAQVEEKVVQILYGYNLAKMKYLNDAGKFIY